MKACPTVDMVSSRISSMSDLDSVVYILLAKFRLELPLFTNWILSNITSEEASDRKYCDE